MSLFRVAKKFGAILSKNQKVKIIVLVVLMILGGFLEMCSVSLVIPFMNMVMSPDEMMEKWYVRLVRGVFGIETSRTFLVFAAIILAIIYILKNIYLVFEYNIQFRFVYGNMFDMQRRLLDNYIYRPYEYFLKVSSGEIIRIINNDTPNTFYMLSVLLNIFSELVVSVIIVGTVFVIAPGATVGIAAVLFLMVLVISSFIKKIMHKAGQDNQRASAGMNKWLLQSIQGIKETKVMGKEAFFQSHYDTYGRIYVNTMRKNAIFGMLPRFFVEGVSMGAMFIVVAVMIYQGQELGTLIPTLTAIAMAAIRLLPSVNRVSTGLSTVAYTEPMLDKLIENLNEMVEHSKEDVMLDAGGMESESMIVGMHDMIDYSGISYTYPDSDDPVLINADMEIHWGESIGIVGESGAGKTTAVDILLGLLRPQKGEILVDGVGITSDMGGWHSVIGYIPQAIFMLDDSIRANVAFGEEREAIDDKKVWNALREASLAEFVRKLPEELDTEIGERGVRLSGGQRQRIGIARALYHNPSVLIFDEATSALDNETEAAIMESIHSMHGQRTMIIIAHRLTTIEDCDHIYRVAEGKITLER